MQKFSIQEAIIFGWTQFKANYLILLLASIASGIITFIPSLISGLISILNEDVANIVSFVLVIPSIYIQLALSMGMLLLIIKIAEKQEVSIDLIFYFLKRYIPVLNYFAASILFMLLFLIAILLPGILLIVGVLNTIASLATVGAIVAIAAAAFVGVRYQFYTFVIVDQKKSAVDSLKKSSIITQGSILDLFLYGLVTSLAAIGGFGIILAIAFDLKALEGNIMGIITGIVLYIIYTFIVTNTIMIATAHIYKKLSR